MVRRIAIWTAWAVLGLSALAWAGSHLAAIHVPLPGGGELLLDHGAVYHSPLFLVTAFAAPNGGPVISANRIMIRGGLILPLWVPVLGSAIALWLLWRVGYERRQLALVGHCSKCRYDLTGIAGVCPECGRENDAARS